MKKKILVTGGGGFIGSHLIEKLIKLGHKVKTIIPYNIDNSWGWIDTFPDNIKKNIDVITGDVCDASLMLKETKKIDVVFHLAALISIPYSYKSPLSYINTNILGSISALEAARVNSCELFVNTSTSEVYGSAQYVPIDEKHPLNAQSPYSASKISSDQLVMSYYKSFGTPVTIIRPFNTFGPRQSMRAAISTIISQVINNNKSIKVGNIETKRDFTYVDDTVMGYIKTLNNKKIIGETINLGTGKDFSISQTINMIKRINKKEHLKIKIDKNRIRPSKSEVTRLISNNRKAEKLLKWKPKFNGKKGFELGLEKTNEWFSNKENVKLYKFNLYNV